MEIHRGIRGQQAGQEEEKQWNKRDTGPGSSMEEDAAADSESEPSDSKVVGKRRIKRAYIAGRIKLFLQKKKNMKGVKVEYYYSDRELFSNSARQQNRERRFY